MQKEMADMQSGESPEDTAAPEKPEADTFFLPSDFPGASDLKAGDSVSLKVVGVSDDGEIEVSVGGGAESGAESLANDLHKSLKE